MKGLFDLQRGHHQQVETCVPETSYRWLWITLCGCGELNSGLLQKQYRLLTRVTSQVLTIYFYFHFPNKRWELEWGVMNVGPLLQDWVLGPSHVLFYPAHIWLYLPSLSSFYRCEMWNTIYRSCKVGLLSGTRLSWDSVQAVGASGPGPSIVCFCYP